jgi:hypothetical protein
MSKSLRLKVISCEVFTREVGHCVARSTHAIDLEFTRKGAHDDSDNLRRIIQDKIDEAENSDQKYDAILLGFGLCGNSISGIQARTTKLIIPRAHDCCTIFLGSKKRFQEIFSDRPSTPFTSVGYMERGGSFTHDAGDFAQQAGLKESFQEYVEIYGEENAQYLWDSLHKSQNQHSDEVVYIEIPELAHLGYADICRQKTQEEQKEFIQVEGSMKILRNLIYGNWNNEEFLVVEPGQKVSAIYDWDEVIGAVPSHDNNN